MSVSVLPATWNDIMRALLLILLALTLTGLQAQEDTADKASEAEQEQTETEQNKARTPEEFDTPDTFEASEKLSEDVSAPFPVDI